MNSQIRKILEDDTTISLLQKKLPLLFQIAELESSRAGKVGMEVGTIRERILVAFLLLKFGESNVKTEIPTTRSEQDVILYERAISIKTISGKRLSSVKLVWTVDHFKSTEFRNEYTPQCDMILVHINWGGNGCFYYIPQEVQLEVLDRLGKDNYIKLPVEGTNPRGVELSTLGVNEISRHQNTFSISIHWNKNDIIYKPYQRWIDLWTNE